MALTFPPSPGDIFMCEFPACFSAPEMVKTRPVIVVSPRLQGRRDLAAVVPISNSAPDPPCPHHCEIRVALLPAFMQATGGNRWAKCDMIYTFNISRLSPIEKRRRSYEKRTYEYRKLDLESLQAVRRAAASGLGIDVSLW